ncbi:hypothetical protein [Actinoplanes derwentensis]|uniref:Uncharacterized protein n=1 Tax=Actinoplanes derwentensis TaxID=113562 RepID=A0A1H2AVP5_9ACTN|nr:hypothetical protein [Actinoplanes derwentensis]GID84272.1 hypothetical protein Ade03nite_31960 [Actinoplanes derwentensis]SDT50058.1 hypothetical protein SAMN04489716_4135 [Actinoplanes derwentensis]
MKRRVILAAGLGGVTVAGAYGLHAVRARDDEPEWLEPIPAAPPAEQDTRKVKPVTYWTGVFMKSWDYAYGNATPLSRSKDSRDHYDLAYDVDACTAMFRATGQNRFLDRALLWMENTVAAAQPCTALKNSSFKDRYQGWASSQAGGGGDEVPLYESYLWRYGTSLLVAMKDLTDPGYQARYRRLLAFAETNLFDKWYARNPESSMYRERTHMSSHWALIAMNLALLTADQGRRSRCNEVVDKISSQLRRQLRRNPVEPTAWFWSDVWGSAKRPGQDVGHGNAVITYVAEARDRDQGWSAADVAAFGTLLTKVIWPGGNTYHAYVDGTGTDNGWWSDGFVKLGRYDPAVQLRLERHQVVNDQFAANMALNARLLLT